MFSFVDSLCFVYVFFLFLILIFVFLFVSFVVSLLYCLSHHLQWRVHDTDPMGGHDSDSFVGPGYFFVHPSGFSCLFIYFAPC